MSGRMEKTREALDLAPKMLQTIAAGGQLVPQPHVVAALAEVEEWETRLAATEAERQAIAQEALDQMDRHRAELNIVIETRDRYVTGWKARAEAAEDRACDIARLHTEEIAAREAAEAEAEDQRRFAAEETERAIAAEAEADRLKAALEPFVRNAWVVTDEAAERTYGDGVVFQRIALRDGDEVAWAFTIADVIAARAALAPADRNTT